MAARRCSSTRCAWNPEVDANHHAGGTDVRCGHTRYDSSAACNVQDALTWPGVSEFHDYRSPLPKYSRHQLALVHLGRAAGNLPLALLAHPLLLEAVATRRIDCLRLWWSHIRST